MINNDVEYLVETLPNFASTNQMVVMYKGKLSRIRRENYLPDDNGLVVLRSQDAWKGEAYSVAEMIEFLRLYKEKITDIKIETYDGSEQRIVTLMETLNAIGDVTYTVFSVGKKGEPLRIPDDMRLASSIK